MPDHDQTINRLTYAQSGVDIDAGDEAADRYLPHMRRTFGPRVIENPGGFAGLFRLDYNEQLFKRNYKEPVLVACADGVGSKVLVARELGRHDTVGIDLVAMNVNDLIVQGAEPLLFLDYIGVHKIEPPIMEAIVAGIADGCEQAGCALLGGETAELPGLYQPGDYDLAGFSVGVVELRRATEPARVEPGDIVLGLASHGLHSNGYSLVRRVVAHAKLDLAAVYPELQGSPTPPQRAKSPSEHPLTLGDVLLTPTRIYARPIVRLQRRYTHKRPITGMAHITGGGLADNLARALPPQADAVIKRGSWPVPPIFPFLQNAGNIDDDEMARVFNMGIGYTLIVKPAFAQSIAQQLTKLGETVFTIGKVVKGKGRVRYA